MKKACVSHENLSLKISAASIENIVLEIFVDGQEFTVQFTAESLFEFLDRLRFAAESVISELDN